MSYSPYVLPYLVSAVLLLAVVPSVWRRRETPGVPVFTLVMLASALWALGNAVEVAGTSLSTKLLAVDFEYVGIMALPVLWLIFALQYAGYQRWITAKRVALLLVVPVITNVLVWTGPYRIMRYGFRLDPSSPTPIVSYGFWFYVASIYSYILLLAGVGVILYALERSQRLYRSQGIVLAAIVLLPVVASVAHVLKVGPLPYLDLTPPSFALISLLIAFGLMRVHLFELVPVARENVVEQLADAVFVSDSRGRLIDANQAARQLFGWDEHLYGQPAAELMPEGVRPALAHPQAGITRLTFPVNGQPRTYEMRLSQVRSSRGLHGWVAMFQDVTEREAMIAELQEALANVRTLSGLIPICASCKKIRDDKGYWQQVEAYISAHSDAVFTHGLCPECAAKLFPEDADRP